MAESTIRNNYYSGSDSISITDNVVSLFFAQYTRGDMDDLKKTYLGYGNYLTNIPSGVSTAGQIVCVFNNTGAYGIQFYSPYSANALYMRNYNSGTWSEWSQL